MAAKYKTSTLRPTKGLDEEMDDLALKADHAEVMLNMQWRRDNGIERRPGFQPDAVSPSGELASDVPKSLKEVGDTLVCVGERRVYKFNDDDDSFEEVGPAPIGSIGTENFLSSKWSQGRHDVAYWTASSGTERFIYRAQVVHVYAEVVDDGSSTFEHRIYLRIDLWGESLSGDRYTAKIGDLILVDSEEGSPITGLEWPFAPKVVASNGKFIVVWAKDLLSTTVDIRASSYNLDGSQIVGPVTVTTDGRSNSQTMLDCPFDVVPIYTDQVAIGWVSAATQAISILVVDNDTIVAASGWVTPVVTDAGFSYEFVSLGIDVNDNTQLYRAGVRTFGVNTIVMPYRYTAQPASFATNTTGQFTVYSGGESVHAVGVSDLLGSDSVLPLAFYVETSVGVGSMSYVLWDLLAFSTPKVINTNNLWEVYNTYPTSGPSYRGNEFLFPAVAKGDVGWTVPGLWQTSVYDNMEPYINGAWDFGSSEPINNIVALGASPHRQGSLNKTKVTPDGYAWSSSIVNNYNEARDTFTRQATLCELDTSFRPDIVPLIKNCAMITGSIPVWFDGNTVMEAGVYASPQMSQGVSATNNSEAVSYVGVFSHTDNQGVLHRGVPGPAVDFASAAGAFSMYLDVNTHSATRSRIYDDFKRLNFDLYLSGTNSPRDSFLRKVNDPDNVHLNGEAAQQAFVYRDNDGTVDAIIYTASGADLEAEPLNACKYMAQVSDRLWAAGFPRPDRAQYSDQFTPAVATANQLVPEFNQQLAFQLPESGAITGLVEDGDRAIVFTEDRVYGFFGDGPNRAGADNDFSKSVTLSDDYGCINPRSIVNFQKGIFFISKTGLCVISKNAVAKLGNVVDSLEEFEILDSFNVPEDDHAVLVGAPTSAGTSIAANILVYDHNHDAWARWDIPTSAAFPNVVAACYRDGGIAMIDGSWNLFSQKTTFEDYNDAAVEGTWKTAWLKFGSDNAWGLWTTLAINMNEWETGVTLDVANEIRISGSSSQPTTAGSHSFSSADLDLVDQDTNPARVSVKVHNDNTRCSAFRASVTMGGTGNGVLSSLSFEYAGKLSNDPQDNTSRGG